MKVLEIAFTCYPATNMARARQFYEGILGLKVTMDHEMEGSHWVEFDIGAGTLSIGMAPGWSPSREGCSISLEMENFEVAVRELKDAGVEFAIEPFETPVCHMAFVRDPDGNSVGIHKRKPGHS